MTDQLPYNLEAEQCLLSCLIQNCNLMTKIKLIIPSGTWFYDTKHSIIYTELLKLNHFDKVILKDHLTRRNLIEQVGGADNIEIISHASPTTSTAPYYANIVREDYKRRQYIQIHTSASLAQANNDDDAYNRAKQELNLMASSFRETPSLETMLYKGLEEMKKRFKGPEMIFGIGDIDKYTSGLTKGWLYVLGARQSHGKTAIALQALWRALSSGKKVVYYSYDLSAPDIFSRLCLHVLKKSTDVVWKSWGIREEDKEPEFQAIKGMGEEIAKAYGDHLFIREYNVDRHTFEDDLMDIHPDLVIFDYIQNAIIRWLPGFKDTQSDWGKFFDSIKDLTNKHNCCTLLLSQFKRPEDRIAAVKRPEDSDYKGSGFIEQAANVAILVDYPYKRTNDINDFRRIDIRIAKVTFGATSGGWLPIYFDPVSQNLRDMSPMEKEDYKRLEGE